MFRNLKPSRRSLLLSALTAPFVEIYDSVAPRAEISKSSIKDILDGIEHASGGRIGVAVFDAELNRHINYRASERFPLCSTFKVMAAGAILKLSMEDPDLLQRRIMFERKDMVTYSPVSKEYLVTGMTVAELCAAALQYSDNTAGNLLLRELGGPEGVTRFARSIGDEFFRLDRWETDLNEALPGDERDTTTPLAMAQSLHKLALGDVLGLAQREQLQLWLQGNTTGAARIRAGAPDDWQIGDKTGAGSYGTTNDIAIAWRRDGAPLIIAIYFTQSRQDAPMRNDLIATTTRAIVAELARNGS